MSNQQANDFLFASGNSFKFDELGDTVRGIIEGVEMRQQTDIDTGEPLTFADGKPRMQLVVTLKTELRESDDDEGIRTIYAKGGNYEADKGEGRSMRDAIADAVKSSGAKSLDEGGELIVAFTGTGVKKNRAYSAPKLYTAGYKPPVASVSANDLFDKG